MVISAGDKILIRELRLSQKWGSKKLKESFLTTILSLQH